MFNTGQIALLLGTMVCLSAGQVLFKLAAVHMEQLQPLIQRWLLNYYFLAALAVYAAGTFLWVSVLRQLPLRLAYPVVALTYLAVPLLSHWLLGEELSMRTIAGAMVIVVGVWISVS
jgi:drug/metabolite transporter (DMT)-like permease